MTYYAKHYIIQTLKPPQEKEGTIMDPKCKECVEAFEKELIPFNPSMCKTCHHGRELHELEMKQSRAEQEWGKCDWSSSKLKELYRG